MCLYLKNQLGSCLIQIKAGLVQQLQLMAYSQFIYIKKIYINLYFDHSFAFYVLTMFIENMNLDVGKTKQHIDSFWKFNFHFAIYVLSIFKEYKWFQFALEWSLM